MKKIYVFIIIILLLVNFVLMRQYIYAIEKNNKVQKNLLVNRDKFIQFEKNKLSTNKRLNLLVLFSDNGCGICAKIVAKKALKLKAKYPGYVKILFFGFNAKILKKYGIKEEDIFYKDKNSSIIIKNNHLIREPILVLTNRKLETILSLVTQPDKKFEVSKFFAFTEKLIEIMVSTEDGSIK